MNISLPQPLKRFVDAQVAAGRYGSVSEYMRELIRLDERRKAKRLEGLLMEGVSSPASEMTAEDWGRLRGGVRARGARRPAR